MAALPDPAGTRAVLIGAARYDDADTLPPLPAVSANLAALRDLLAAPDVLGLPPGHCRVIAEPASPAVLQQALRDAADDATDTLIVYYAGHGLIHPADGSLYLALPGTARDLLESTGAAYDWVRTAVRSGPAARRVVILDCCFAGRALNTMAAGDLIGAVQVDGTAVIAAAGRNRTALAEPGERFTAFTGELIELLTRGVPGGPELLDLNAIALAVTRTLEAKGRPRPSRAFSENIGDLAFRNRAAGREPVPAEPVARRLPCAPRVVVDVRPHGTATYPAAGYAVEVRTDEGPIAAHDMPALDGGSAPGTPAEYGRWLFDQLLGPAWQKIAALPEVAAYRGVELALRWPADTGLHAFGWEAIHDGTAPLAAHPALTVAITRVVPGATSESVRTVGRIPRVLVVDGPTDRAVMFLGLARAFDGHGAGVTQRTRLERLAERCGAFQPDIVYLAAPDGDPATLAAALSAGGRPQVVLVGGGRTDLAAALAAAGVPIVVRLDGDISNPACRLYVRSLIHAVKHGKPLAEAAAHGRRAALLRAAEPPGGLGWARPALFVGDAVPAGFQVARPEPIAAVLAVADRLEWREAREPVFIERTGVFRPIDRFFTDSGTPRLVLYGNERPIGRLGGTRLLREIRFRLLLRGHVGLMLGSYGPGDAPHSLRAVVDETFQAILDMGRKLRFAPTQATALGRADLTAAALRGLTAGQIRERLAVGLGEFRVDAAPLDHDATHERLAADLAAFARQVGTLRPPFGEHTRVVLLADELHTWEDAATEPLRAMIRRGGIGLDTPVPLVGTACYTEGKSGPQLRDFRDRHRNPELYAYPELAPLPPDEALTGFEHALLHPWRDDFPHTYTRAPHGSPTTIASVMGKNGDRPTAVADVHFYNYADILVEFDQFVRHDDDAAFRDYSESQR